MILGKNGMQLKNCEKCRMRFKVKNFLSKVQNMPSVLHFEIEKKIVWTIKIFIRKSHPIFVVKTLESQSKVQNIASVLHFEI